MDSETETDTEIEIRAERDGDGPPIAAVVSAAFGRSVEAELVDAIRDSPGFVRDWSLVAEHAGQVVGHVMVSYVTLSDDDAQHRIASLAPLAVAPDHQRRGIGAALVRVVTRRVDDAGEPLVVLEGSPQYYGRLGFEHSVPLGIEIALPDWAPPEAAQVMRLTAYDPALRGRVLYPPAFDVAAEDH